MAMTDEDFLDNVDRIIDAGGTVTDEYTRLKGRLSAFHSLENASLALLKQAVASDVPMDRVAELRSLSYAELATPPEQAVVRNAVRGELIRLLRVEYAQTAEGNYEGVGLRFNDTASRYTDAHHTVPASTDPATLVSATAKVRNAWTEGQALAVELTALADLLVVAASLTGRQVGSKGARVGLTVLGAGLHRRELWDAYDAGWSAVLDLGAELHAPDLEQFEALAEPRAIETRYVQGDMGMRAVEWDPEDEHTAEEEAQHFTLT
ncbi:hypothetical protein GCM10009706_29080 [Curtobacterium citreum]|uniref:DUF222 domain-containing protein n=1 Tax=Curtobacterium citreum TaxID=2036 RepID=A0ABT2HKT7_9MICO|nr:hypothetical protein [Curtobacterium citreum]MCS6523889.1 hypothetical protein [Curtobacterium citreum]TQJ29001.1 hypothetical protein FB462_2908 [Curtobacterium citreum]GGL88610.1 hypothetical protein GCM10009706_29080 [Curtobacterium citreum]